ncbi:lytic murein transglycosylase [Rodentibacter caecimuris]|uniref:Lytic transglycosylase n=1 Tax=Rodentibacter caecimuris TaxID=1796644 RepID=A0ABX3KW46_9PAST|nr:lytic transglycosylase [Rodentibacter heylii]
MLKLKMSGVLLIAWVLVGCSTQSDIRNIDVKSVYSKPRVLQNFDDYVQFLKSKAASQGVSTKVLASQQNIRYIQKSVNLDRQQAGRVTKHRANILPTVNPPGTNNYLRRVLTGNKVNVAEEYYWERKPELERASKELGVQQEYLLALWGMESSFGYYQGNYDVLSVLATLSFEGRRENLFSKEFISAMKILERGDIERSKLLGSWAGAMGQTQFMPSSYLRYAADGNGDGEKDIWKNHYDVFASIANYLHTVGWDDKLPWGVEVNLTQYIPIDMSGIEKNKARSWHEWQTKGIVLQSPQDLVKLTALSQSDLWLVRPDREVGRAFLVSNNFRTILDWNRSNYFALSIGMFADKIKARLNL